MVTDIRSNWGDKVPVWKPMFSQQKGLRLGITRQQVANSFRTATNGLPLGEYREGDVSLPILLKDEDVEKMNLNDVKSVPVFSTKGNSVKVEQVIDNFALGYDYNVVRRFNRERCMMMQCEPKRGANTMAAFKQVLTAVQEQMQLPEGYKMKYFGEQETQDVSNAALAKNIPLTFPVDLCGSAVSFPQQLPQAGIDYAYVAAGVYRCGMGIALVWQVIGLLCHPRSVGIDWYEYQECHCAGR